MSAVQAPFSNYAGVATGALDAFKNAQGNTHLIHNERITLADGSVANTTFEDLKRYKIMAWYGKVQTTSTLSQLFVVSANRFFDFTIPDGSPDTVKGAYLSMTFSNADAVNDCQLPPAEFLFQEYQELSNGSDASITFTPEQMWFLNGMGLGIERYYHYAKMSNTVGNPTTATSIPGLYAATDVVPASGTATCQLLLNFSAFVQSRSFLPAIRRPPRLRFYPNSNPWINSNVNNDVTLTDVQLVLYGNVYTPDVKQRLYNIYSTSGTITRTFTIQYWQQQIAIVSGTEVGPLVMTNIAGEISGLVFFLRSSAAAYNATTLWTEGTSGLIDFTYVTIKNGTSTPLWYDKVERVVLRHHVPFMSNPTLWTGGQPVYMFPHTVDVNSTLNEGSHYGGYNYTNNQSITITPSATSAAANNMGFIQVHGLRYSAQVQNAAGQLYILRF